MGAGHRVAKQGRDKKFIVIAGASSVLTIPSRFWALTTVLMLCDRFKRVHRGGGCSSGGLSLWDTGLTCGLLARFSIRLQATQPILPEMNRFYVVATVTIFSLNSKNLVKRSRNIQFRLAASWSWIQEGCRLKFFLFFWRFLFLLLWEKTRAHAADSISLIRWSEMSTFNVGHSESCGQSLGGGQLWLFAAAPSVW